MRTKTRTMDATITIDDEEIEASVEYSYTPGCPATGPTYDCGGTPPEPPEVDILYVNIERGDVEVNVLAELSDDQISTLIEKAFDDFDPYDGE